MCLYFPMNNLEMVFSISSHQPLLIPNFILRLSSVSEWLSLSHFHRRPSSLKFSPLVLQLWEKEPRASGWMLTHSDSNEKTGAVTAMLT